MKSRSSLAGQNKLVEFITFHNQSLWLRDSCQTKLSTI